MEETEEQLAPTIKIGAASALVATVLVALIILQHNLAFQGKGTIIIPAGNTYLGPSTTSPSPSPTVGVAITTSLTPTNTPASKATEAPTQNANALTAPANTQWVTVKGRIYGYFFKAPKTFNLVTFPNDPYDIYAISWNNQPPQSNVLIGVDNLNNRDQLKQYVSVSKRAYVEDWWKQFGGLKGVGSITDFTNSQGLKGYKAKYLNSQNQSPNDDIFFEAPNHPELVIHLANGIMDKNIFDKLVDSVGWSGNK